MAGSPQPDDTSARRLGSCRSRRENATGHDPAPQGSGGGRSAGGRGARSPPRPRPERGQRRRRPPIQQRHLRGRRGLGPGHLRARQRRRAAAGRPRLLQGRGAGLAGRQVLEHPRLRRAGAQHARGHGPRPGLRPGRCRDRLERPRRGGQDQRRRAGCHRRRQPLELLRHRGARGGRRARGEGICRWIGRVGRRWGLERVGRQHQLRRQRPADRGDDRCRRRRRVPVLPMVVGPTEATWAVHVTGGPGRGRAEGPGRGRGGLEPGHRPGRSDRAARRPCGGGERLPRRCDRVRRPAGRPGRGRHP